MHQLNGGMVEGKVLVGIQFHGYAFVLSPDTFVRAQADAPSYQALAHLCEEKPYFVKVEGNRIPFARRHEALMCAQKLRGQLYHVTVKTRPLVGSERMLATPDKGSSTSGKSRGVASRLWSARVPCGIVETRIW